MLRYNQQMLDGVQVVVLGYFHLVDSMYAGGRLLKIFLGNPPVPLVDAHLMLILYEFHLFLKIF